MAKRPTSTSIRILDLYAMIHHHLISYSKLCPLKQIPTKCIPNASFYHCSACWMRICIWKVHANKSTKGPSICRCYDTWTAFLTVQEITISIVVHHYYAANVYFARKQQSCNANDAVCFIGIFHFVDVQTKWMRTVGATQALVALPPLTGSEQVKQMSAIIWLISIFGRGKMKCAFALAIA